MKRILIGLFCVSFCLSFTACITVQTPQPAAPAPTPGPTLAPKVTLDWEKNHAERAGWTKALLNDLQGDFNSLEKASDAKTFCPKYDSLTREQKVQMFATLLVWTSYYECGWSADEASVDVGQKDDVNTYSVGLLQLSVIDQVSYHLPFGFSYEDLQDGVKNLLLGTAIFSGQLDKYGKILIAKGEKGLYWATLHPGGDYDKSKEIIAHVKALEFCQ